MGNTVFVSTEAEWNAAAAATTASIDPDRFTVVLLDDIVFAALPEQLNLENTTLDGLGHTLTLPTATDWEGLVIMEGNAQVRNVWLDASNVASIADNNGLLAHEDARGAVFGCHVIGTVTGVGTGGIMGGGSIDSGSVIVGCSIRPPDGSDVCVRGEGTGGIAGNPRAVDVLYCVCHGDLAQGVSSGGIVGRLTAPARLEGCVMVGDVVGGNSSGGIVGVVAGSTPTVHGCAMHGAVTYTAGAGVFGNGGICGLWTVRGTIFDSYATGSTGAGCGVFVAATGTSIDFTLTASYANGAMNTEAALLHTLGDEGGVTFFNVHASDVSRAIRVGNGSQVFDNPTLLAVPSGTDPQLWIGFDPQRWLAVPDEPPLLRVFQNVNPTLPGPLTGQFRTGLFDPAAYTSYSDTPALAPYAYVHVSTVAGTAKVNVNLPNPPSPIGGGGPSS